MKKIEPQHCLSYLSVLSRVSCHYRAASHAQPESMENKVFPVLVFSGDDGEKNNRYIDSDAQEGCTGPQLLSLLTCTDPEDI